MAFRKWSFLWLPNQANLIMVESKSFERSPLSQEEIEQIEKAPFSAIERHHLRLLAHCLACFKSMDNDSNLLLPDENKRLEWFLSQPSLLGETAFVSVLLQQFASAASQLEHLAHELNIPPLQLTLDHLIAAKKMPRSNQ